MKYDMAIIGGGVAGLALALDMKKRGHSVALIEKGSYPRHKVCGEYVSMESHQYLHQLYPSLVHHQLPRISRFKLTAPGGGTYSAQLPLGGFGISRYLLETLLYREAEQQGVVFRLNSRARAVAPAENGFSISVDNMVMQAALVCDASGRRPGFGLKGEAPAVNYIGVKYHVKLERDPEQIELHNFKGGYCGISNVEGNVSCLCYMVNGSQLRQNGNSIPRLEKEVLYANPELKKIFTAARFVSREPLTTSNISFRVRQPVKEGILCLGDAAGSIAPVTGNGMSMALRAASMIAMQADLFLQGKITRSQLYHAYSAQWKKQFASRIRLGRYVQRLSEYSFLTRCSIGLFNIFPSLGQAVIRSTHGQPF